MKILLALRPCSPGLAHRVAADDTLAKALGAKPNPAVGFLFPASSTPPGRCCRACWNSPTASR